MASIAAISGFTEEEIAVDEGLGYPKAYVKLCRDRDLSPYSHGPPFTFTPYTLQQREVRVVHYTDFLCYLLFKLEKNGKKISR